jgi:hypothetical protein
MSKPTISIIPPASADDPIPAQHRAVIELFSNQLAKVAFPDVDATLLRRHADEVRAAALEVARARDALDAAQTRLAERTALLGETAARGLAYARIYADAHPDRHALATAIAELAEPGPPLLSSPIKRRGRPPRQSVELFATPAAAEPAP